MNSPNSCASLPRSLRRRTRTRLSAKHWRYSQDAWMASPSKQLSPGDKDKLFLPHFSTKDRGTGLGLAIAARIVAEHGGRIHVEDNLPVGSRFLVELPVAELTPASLADHNGSDGTR